MLLVSDLPEIIWHYLAPPDPDWLVYPKAGLLVLFLLACLVVTSLRPL